MRLGPLRVLGEGEWGEVHALMVARDFPHVPAQLVEAEGFFRDALLVGWRDEAEHLAVVVAFGRPDDGVAFVDVVCRAEWMGRWAHRRVLRALARLAFDTLKLRALWAEVFGAVALRTALRVGFVGIGRGRKGCEVVVLTPGHIPKRWLNKERKGG